jgi:peptidoglycan/LPS O-acetylase OafA/YrhL
MNPTPWPATLLPRRAHRRPDPGLTDGQPRIASGRSARGGSWRDRLEPLRAESEDMLHLDTLRLIASAGIVIFHMGLPVWDSPAWARVWSWRVDFNLFVDLFFVISGYVITAVYGARVETRAQYGAFLQRRLARLLPLHLVTLGAFVLIGLGGMAHLFMLNDGGRYNWSCLPTNLLLTQSFGGCPTLAFNFVSWSISAEFWMYVIFPLLLLPRRAGGIWLSMVTMAALATLLAAPRLWHVDTAFYDWTAPGGVARALGGFLLGMTFFQHRGALAKIPAPDIAMWTLLAAFLVGGAMHADKAWLLVLMYATAAAAIAADQRGRAGALVRRLAPGGQLTYSLYMLHPVMGAVGVGLVGIDLLDLQGAVMRWWILGCTALLAPAAYLSLMLLERPARRWISDLKWPSRVPADLTAADLRSSKALDLRGSAGHARLASHAQTRADPIHDRAPNLQDELRQRLSALPCQGGAEGAHEG